MNSQGILYSRNSGLSMRTGTEEASPSRIFILSLNGIWLCWKQSLRKSILQLHKLMNCIGHFCGEFIGCLWSVYKCVRILRRIPESGRLNPQPRFWEI